MVRFRFHIQWRFNSRNALHQLKFFEEPADLGTTRTMEPTSKSLALAPISSTWNSWLWLCSFNLKVMVWLQFQFLNFHIFGSNSNNSYSCKLKDQKAFYNWKVEIKIKLNKKLMESKLELGISTELWLQLHHWNILWHQLHFEKLMSFSSHSSSSLFLTTFALFQTCFS